VLLATLSSERILDKAPPGEDVERRAHPGSSGEDVGRCHSPPPLKGLFLDIHKPRWEGGEPRRLWRLGPRKLTLSNVDTFKSSLKTFVFSCVYA